MASKIFKAKKSVVSIAALLLFCVSLAAAVQTIMNGKEVKPYDGFIVSHNERTGEIVVKMDNSTGHWRLSHHTVVFYGKERLNLSDIWGKTKRVEVFVSRDGEVERITVLEWK